MKIKEIAKKENKKIGKKAIDKVKDMLQKYAEDLIRKAARNADFAGRKTIKEEDLN